MSQIWPIFTRGRWGYRCSCGWATQLASYPLISIEGGAVELPSAEVDPYNLIQRHLAAEHSDEVGYGLCDECGVITNDFRALVRDLGLDKWLCLEHAPNPNVVDQAADEEERCET